eukprot:3600213-Rhodomonas_salina.1
MHWHVSGPHTRSCTRLPHVRARARAPAPPPRQEPSSPLTLFVPVSCTGPCASSAPAAASSALLRHPLPPRPLQRPRAG